MVFKTDTLSISELLSGSNTFHIPTFQRAFSWTEVEAAQLFDDLCLAEDCGHNASRRSLTNGSYFLGSIIVGRGSDNGAYYLIDGQQRLITLTVILAILRDCLNAEEDQKALQVYIERPTNSLLFERSPRILLHPRWQEYFERWVVHPGGTRQLPEHHDDDVLEGLLGVIKRLREEFCIPRIPSTANVISLSRFVLTKTCVLMLTAQNMDDAYLLFRSVNTPGRPLSALDLIKSELLGETTHGSAANHRMAESWAEIEAEIGQEGLEDYVNTIADLVMPSDGESTLKTRVHALLHDRVHMTSFRSKLAAFVKSYANLSNATLAFGADSGRINRIVACLHNLPFEEWRPLALLYLSTNPSAAKAYDFFGYLNSLCLGICVLGTREPKRVKRFKEITALIVNGKDPFALSSPLFISDDERPSIKAKLRKGIKDVKFIRHLLLRINAEMQTEEIPIYFPDNITIEHVLPQKPAPRSERLKIFGDPTRRKQLCMCLGNLTILTGPANAEIGNSDFQKKKDLVFGVNGNQAFAMNNEIARKPRWDEQAILMRHESLLAVADKVLRL